MHYHSIVLLVGILFWKLSRIENLLKIWTLQVHGRCYSILQHIQCRQDMLYKISWCKKYTRYKEKGTRLLKHPIGGRSPNGLQRWRPLNVGKDCSLAQTPMDCTETFQFAFLTHLTVLSKEWPEHYKILIWEALARSFHSAAEIVISVDMNWDF